MIDPRDVARIRTEARLVQLAIAGLMTELPDHATPADPQAAPKVGDVELALRTAHEFAERCQVALTAAAEKLPDYRA